MTQIEKLALLGLAMLVAGLTGLAIGIVMGYIATRIELSFALIIASSILAASGGLILALAQLTNELIGWRENQRVPSLITPSSHTTHNIVKPSTAPLSTSFEPAQTPKIEMLENQQDVENNKEYDAKNSQTQSKSAIIVSPDAYSNVEQNTPLEYKITAPQINDLKNETPRTRPVLPLVGAAATAAAIAAQMGNKLSQSPPVLHDEIASSLEALLEKAGLSESEKNMHRQTQIFKETVHVSSEANNLLSEPIHNLAHSPDDSIRSNHSDESLQEIILSEQTMERLISEALSGETLIDEKLTANAFLEHTPLDNHASQVYHEASSLADNIEPTPLRTAVNDTADRELPVTDFDMDMMLARLVLPQNPEQNAALNAVHEGDDAHASADIHEQPPETHILAALHELPEGALNAHLAAALETHLATTDDTHEDVNNDSSDASTPMSLEAFIEAQLKDLDTLSTPVASAWEGQTPYNLDFQDHVPHQENNNHHMDTQPLDDLTPETHIDVTTQQITVREPLENIVVEPHTDEPLVQEVSSTVEAAVVGRYTVGDHDYVMFSDGSIEAHTSEGHYHFSSMDDLKSFIDELSQRQLSNDDQLPLPAPLSAPQSNSVSSS